MHLKRTVAATLISLLEDGEKPTSLLLSELRKTKRNITKQAFYAALRQLKAREIVVIYKGVVALHTSWVNDMRDALARIEKAYATGSTTVGAFSLSEKESASYIFSTVRHLDSFWGHAQTVLVTHTPKSEAIYAYNPHYWFYLARAETEKKLLKEIATRNRQFLMTAGTNTPLDCNIAKEFKGDFLQYTVSKVFPTPNHYYVTAIGDYTIEVFLEKGLAKQIDDIYAHYAHASPKAIEALQHLLTIKSRNKIKITRSRAKAASVRKALAKNFYVKR